MAVGTWVVPAQTKKLLGSGSIDLTSGVFKLALVKSTVALSAAQTASTWASVITDGVVEVVDGNNYSTSGLNLAQVSWRASGNNYVFDFLAFSLSANGGNIASIFQACVRVSAGNRILCFVSLSSAAFTLADGNKLTITPPTAGVFDLT